MIRFAFLIQSLIFKSAFKILAKVLARFCQNQRLTCLKPAAASGKNLIYECVACVCLTFGSISLFLASFVAVGIMMGVITVSLHYQLIYTKLFGSRKMVSLQKFYFKGH